MSKQQPKKRVAPAVAPVQRQPQRNYQQQAAPQRNSPRVKTESIFGTQEMIFGRQNYLIMLGGLGLVTLGLILMIGGAMPSNDVWDESTIYSFRRITLAPLCMLIGFATVIWGIFRKNPEHNVYVSETETSDNEA